MYAYAFIFFVYALSFYHQVVIFLILIYNNSSLKFEYIATQP